VAIFGCKKLAHTFGRGMGPLKICRTRYMFYTERGYLPHCSQTLLCSQLNSRSNNVPTLLGAVPLNPHFLVSCARFIFSWPSDEHKLPS